MNEEREKKCIHTYLTKCKTNPQPPGFADYLRGTITLYNFSRKYGYTLLLDDTHPLFKFIKKTEYHITDASSDIIELLPPFSYDEIFDTLNNLFKSGTSFSVMTNSFYNRTTDQYLSNWGDISEDCQTFLKHTFAPSMEIESKLDSIFNSIFNSIYHIKKEFKVIHLRLGDKFIHNNVYDDKIYNSYFTKINALVNSNAEDKYVLISDSSIIANKLKENIKQLLYWDNHKIHIGDLLNNTNSSLFDTLTDFFIMSKAKEIISDGCSGFSIAVSLIYKIKHTVFN